MECKESCHLFSSQVKNLNWMHVNSIRGAVMTRYSKTAPYSTSFSGSRYALLPAQVNKGLFLSFLFFGQNSVTLNKRT